MKPLSIPKWKWNEIAMDPVVGLPKTNKGHDTIWVIIDRCTKSTHFIPIHVTCNLDQFAQLYIQEIVRLHGIPKHLSF